MLWYTRKYKNVLELQWDLNHRFLGKRNNKRNPAGAYRKV